MKTTMTSLTGVLPFTNYPARYNACPFQLFKKESSPAKKQDMSYC